MVTATIYVQRGERETVRGHVFVEAFEQVVIQVVVQIRVLPVRWLYETAAQERIEAFVLEGTYLRYFKYLEYHTLLDYRKTFLDTVILSIYNYWAKK